MFFPPPERIDSEVFTRLPDAFRTPCRTAWADAYGRGRALDSFLEGPSFDRDGNLYVTDIPHGRVFRIARDGSWTLVADYDGWPNGLKIDAGGRIVITDNKRGLIVLDPASGRIDPLAETWRGERFKGVNDLFIAANGDIYFTDQGQTGWQDATGRVFRLTPAGMLHCLLDTAPSPNGLVANLPGDALLVGVTRANAVWRLPLMADGGVCKAGTFIQLSGGLGGPDGLALDIDGGIAVCHLGIGVWRFDALGLPTHLIGSAAGPLCTNCAFDPQDPGMLYITESETGTILRARLPVPGHPMASHAR